MEKTSHGWLSPGFWWLPAILAFFGWQTYLSVASILFFSVSTRPLLFLSGH
jgi:hypothetical protein